MLTSFFNNSKPFHFIVLSLLLLAGCFVYIIQDLNVVFNYEDIASILFKNTIFLLVLLLLSFIIKKTD